MARVPMALSAKRSQSRCVSANTSSAASATFAAIEEARQYRSGPVPISLMRLSIAYGAPQAG
ncbi:hypothetical protein GCM10029978_093880 [Actinoallomurus acanthiterrae]